jgi:hypothetical protein
MFKKIYLHDKVGRFALLMLFSTLFIAGDLAWGGPPSRDALKVHVGVLEGVDVYQGFPCQNGYRDTTYTLRVHQDDGTVVKPELFEKCGNSFTRGFQLILGKRTEVRTERGWVWEVTSGGTAVVDYDQKARASRNPRYEALYGIFCAVVFGAISVRRYRAVKAAPAAPTATTARNETPAA